jgi:CheY-like chemotaxis protein
MRVVIAEDSAVVRAGLAEILADRGHDVVAAVGDGEALLAAVAEHHPDVTVVDVRMPPGYTDEGLRAAIEIRRRHPATGVLVFSQYIETRYAAPARRDVRRQRQRQRAAPARGRRRLPAQRPGGRRRGVRRGAQPGGGRRHRA